MSLVGYHVKLAAVALGAFALIGGCAVDLQPSVATVSTALEGCDDQTAIVSCDPGTGGSVPVDHGGIYIGDTLASCVSTSALVGDRDHDGVDDPCETRIAAAFAPGLWQSNNESDFEWDRSLIGGEYYYAVTQTTTSTGAVALRIAYLPAYYRDEGSGNFFSGGGGHDGDSEFAVVDVAYDAGTSKWYFLRAFLSAHCGSTLPILTFVTFNANCQWWNADMWLPANGGATVNGVLNGAPIIWVARGKHAFYTSAERCDSGQLGAEICDDGAAESYGHFPVSLSFNIGSRAIHLNNSDNEPGRRFSPLAKPGTYESLWSQTFFRGWQLAPYTGDMPTPYGQILYQFGF